MRSRRLIGWAIALFVLILVAPNASAVQPFTIFDTTSVKAPDSTAARDSAAIKGDSSSSNANKNLPQKSIGKNELQVFGEGAIQSYARGDSSDSPASGSIGVQLLKHGSKERWTASITVASSVDTIVSGFGSVLLTSAAGIGFQSGSLDVQREFESGLWSNRFTRKLHAYATTARVRFAVDSVTVREAVIVGVGLSRYGIIGSGRIAENGFSLSVEAGLACRALAGDVGGRDNRELRRTLLGTACRLFVGPDLGMSISFRDISASVHYYQLFDTAEKARVDGLTTGQVVASIGIRGTILAGVLD